MKYSKLLVDPTLKFETFWAYTIYEPYLDVIKKMKARSFQYVLIDDFKLPVKGELTNNQKSHSFFIYEVLDLINRNGAENIKGLKLVDKFSVGGREQYLFEIPIKEFPKIISTSNLNSQLNANGILNERVPAWHSSRYPNYPQAIQIEFENKREIQEVGFLPQIGHQERGPKLIKIYNSEDGLNWNEIKRSENICNSSFNKWKYVNLDNSYETRHIKIEILSNCGTIDHVTIRGIKFK